MELVVPKSYPTMVVVRGGWWACTHAALVAVFRYDGLKVGLLFAVHLQMYEPVSPERTHNSNDRDECVIIVDQRHDVKKCSDGTKAIPA